MNSTVSDQLQRWMFEHINARCVHVRLDAVRQQAIGHLDCPAPVERLLAEAMLVVGLLSSGIKFKGRISLQLQSSSGLKLLLADCTDDGGLRCVARMAEDAVVPEDVESVWADLSRNGILTLTLEPSGQGERWQGIVPLEGDTLAEAIENYFIRSEQLATRVRLAVDDEHASALMIQRMPGPSEDDDGWNRLEQLLATLSEDELLRLPGAHVVTRLFHEEDRRQFPERPLRFHCPCSRQRVAEVLDSLGRDELDSMIAEGETVDVQCEFCGTNYAFDTIELMQLIADPAPGESRTVH
jgi:molecular chaperone Hsp33